MPAPFKQITVDQFAELLSNFPFTRHINAVHLHHTWRPNREQYRGHDTIVAMWRFHTQDRHWSDIAQHVTIAPDGTIWLGRDWNRPPASASGHNGNEQAGPFMVEMIGDFDHGQDPFDGAQRSTALDVIARVQLRFQLPPGSLQFHHMMSAKSCPGTGIDYQAVLGDVAQLHTQLAQPARRGSADFAPADSPFPPDSMNLPRVVREAIEDLRRPTARGIDPADAEPCARGPEATQADADEGTGKGADDGVRGLLGIRFGAADLQAMRPHVVNLRMGRFSTDGDWRTAPQDVDAIFDDHLPAAAQAARAQGRPLRLMFYAHGGLTDEATALAAARDRIDWWTANGIYPIYFIWETGLVEILRQMLERRRQDRGLLSDYVGDPLVEAFAHRAGGVQIWSAMKWSAQQASAADAEGASGTQPGGAWYLAQKLAAFCAAYPDVELHGVGHSAGSIFHAHFIPCALAHGVPAFASLHLLAPAVRVDVFRRQLAPLVGDGVKQLTMYTMYDSYEKQDTCDFVYRKSLLYLVHRALEPEADTPILGLERCVRADAALKTLFGIGTGGAGGSAAIVWSDNGLAYGRSASTAHAHGAFDDDGPTMGSVVRRILGLQDADRIVDLPRPRRIGDPWHAGTAWAGVPQPPAGPGWMVADAAPAPAALQEKAQQLPQAPADGGRRSALCVGIDTYPTAPLGGCVNDARAWADTLARLGFETRMLVDADATRDGIVGQLMALVGGSRAGDVLVFQYAGHGTQVPDLDGDEADGDTPGEDEALCPYDFASGELLVDDDMRAIFRRLPDGVNLTCFFDCCHSGTITRFAVGGQPGAGVQGRRARFVRADPALVAAYTDKRRAMPFRAAPDGGQDTMREVVFSACLSSEVAMEDDGHGDFTRNAIQVFGQGIGGVTNGGFADRVTQAFGAAPRQHAKLYSSDAARLLPLLQPLVQPLVQPLLRPSAAPARVPAPAAGRTSVQEVQALADELVRASRQLG